jgi:hypothetical protein
VLGRFGKLAHYRECNPLMLKLVGMLTSTRIECAAVHPNQTRSQDVPRRDTEQA